MPRAASDKEQKWNSNIECALRKHWSNTRCLWWFWQNTKYYFIGWRQKHDLDRQCLGARFVALGHFAFTEVISARMRRRADKKQGKYEPFHRDSNSDRRRRACVEERDGHTIQPSANCRIRCLALRRSANICNGIAISPHPKLNSFLRLYICSKLCL